MSEMPKELYVYQIRYPDGIMVYLATENQKVRMDIKYLRSDTCIEKEKVVEMLIAVVFPTPTDECNTEVRHLWVKSKYPELFGEEGETK